MVETNDPRSRSGRATRVIDRVYRSMTAGNWYKIDDIHARILELFYVDDNIMSVAAAMRSLRTKKYGAHLIDRHLVTAGVYQYRLREDQT